LKTLNVWIDTCRANLLAHRLAFAGNRFAGWREMRPAVAVIRRSRSYLSLRSDSPSSISATTRSPD
jgi:hypothetical protein